MDYLSKAILKKLAELNISQEEFAYRLGMTRKTLYSRLKNPEQFKLLELRRIKDICGLSIECFLNKEVELIEKSKKPLTSVSGNR